MSVDSLACSSAPVCRSGTGASSPRTLCKALSFGPGQWRRRCSKVGLNWGHRGNSPFLRFLQSKCSSEVDAGVL